MDNSELVALLGRPLTPGEITNKDLYIEIAQESLEGLLCISLDTPEEPSETATLTFNSRKGYSTVFTEIFRSVSEVKLDGQTVSSTDYYASQWDNRNASWFNSLVFNRRLHGEDVSITGTWGFTEVPTDLKKLWAQLFVQAGSKYSSAKVQSKQTEDFRITFATDVSEDEKFINDNLRTINKYKLCNIGEIRHGKRHYGC